LIEENGHRANAFSLIEVIKSGMTTEAKPEQPSNAEYPMEMTEFGIKTHSNPI